MNLKLLRSIQLWQKPRLDQSGFKILKARQSGFVIKEKRMEDEYRPSAFVVFGLIVVLVILFIWEAVN